MNAHPPNHPSPRFPGLASCACQAFTLIEMMLAIAIFAGVLAAIYSTWSAILRSSKSAAFAATEAQRTRITISTLEQAFQSVQFFEANAPLYSFETDTTGEDAAISFVARLPASFPRSGQFGGLRLRRVTFAVERAPGGTKTLMLRQRAVLAEPDPDQEENPVQLARNLSGFGLDFWGPNSTDWEPEWLLTNQLPRLVRFWLEFQGPAGSSAGAEMVTRVVPLGSLGVPASVQLSGRRLLNQRGGTNQPPAGGLPPRVGSDKRRGGAFAPVEP